MIRVVVAEDSPTVRALLAAILEDDPEIRIVGTAATGAEAIELAEALRPDLITMDVNMPGVDGLAATKEIMVRAPTPIVIVSSRADQDVDLSLSALRAGAVLVLPTPEGPGSDGFVDQAAHLRTMARAMAGVRVVRRWPERRRPSVIGHPGRGAGRVRLVAIGASTGGPAALQELLAGLPRTFAAPILVVQHIAADFVPGLAQWLTRACDLRVEIAREGVPVQPRTVYLAPDHLHLGIGREGRIRLSDSPPIRGFRPSVSHLFQSAAAAYGSHLAAVILTGMGSDGVDGLHHVRAAGGLVLAQDEASSVVFGMPGAAVAAGVVDAVLPVREIASRLVSELASGETR